MFFLKRLKKYKEMDLDVPQEKRPELEKGDLPAMLLAAFVTLILPAALILLVLVLIVLLLFGAL